MFSVKIEGLEKVQRELEELGDAVRALDGTLCDLRFDPSDADSVRDAIAQMEKAVDAKTARWRNNSAVREIAQRSKERFREAILDRASTARRPETE